MSASKQAAKYFRDVHFGGNWTDVNIKETLSDVTWEQAQKKVGDLNSIATLAVHIKYFVSVVLKVLKGGPLEGKDALSFDHSFIQSQEDWENFLKEWWDQTEQVAKLVEVMPEEKLFGPFVDPIYGDYYRQIHGMIEHAHYHLGQITLIKKMINSQEA